MPEFTLAPLPYAYDALEPIIDKETMTLHHDKHHLAYVNGLNAGLKDHADLQNKTVEELLKGINSLPEAVRTPVRNHGGGHYNHNLYWELMTPGGAKEPTGALAEAINATFGNVENLKTQVNDAGMKRFGSGWSWLVVDNGKLLVISTANQDCPLMDNQTPILGVDVWEHAYYLKYQNKRADYVDAFFKVINWDYVSARFAEAGKG